MAKNISTTKKPVKKALTKEQIKKNQKKDSEWTLKGNEWSTPEIKRRQKRNEVFEKNEQAIKKKQQNSLLYGIKGAFMGNSYMGAVEDEERVKRYKANEKIEKEALKAKKRRTIK